MPESRKIIRNVYVLSCDDEGAGGVGTVTIRNDRITSVSYGISRHDAPAPDVEVIDGTGKVLLPGFVDLHVHGESLLFDLMTAGEPQGRWHKLPRYVRAQEYWYQRATIDDWRRLYTTVFFQALRSGVTFLGEYGSPGNDHACKGAHDAFNRTELQGLLTLHNADQLECATSEPTRQLRYAIALPPAEELTTYNLQATTRLARESGLPIMVHMGDGDKDVETIVRNFGKTPVQVLEEFGALDPGCLLVHLNVTEPRDVQRIVNKQVIPVLSPCGAVRKGLPYPPVQTYRALNIRLALSTDWGPFSHWATMRSLFEREMSSKSQSPSALAYLRDLTAVPAAALGMGHEVGSITAGKRANLQMISIRNLGLQAALGSLAPEAVAQSMIQRIGTTDVSDVMVNGEFSVREGMVLTYSEEDIVADIRDLLTIHEREQDRQRPEAAPAAIVATDVHLPELGEEGFRILRRTEDVPEVPAANILRLEPEREPKREQPKPVRRVFGEDDF